MLAAKFKCVYRGRNMHLAAPFAFYVKKIHAPAGPYQVFLTFSKSFKLQMSHVRKVITNQFLPDCNFTIFWWLHKNSMEDSNTEGSRSYLLGKRTLKIARKRNALSGSNSVI